MNDNQRTALIGLALLASLTLVIALAPKPDRETSPDFAQESSAEAEAVVLIDLSDRLDAREREAFVSALPGSPALNSVFSEREGLYRVSLPGAEAELLLRSLAGSEAVEFAELEGTYEALGSVGAAEVNDPLYQFQWHFDQIDVEEGWSLADGSGVIVAVIDTGVAFADAPGGQFRRVRDLAGNNFAPGYDFVSDDDQPFDEHGHGTHVAGTIAQTTNNAYGVAGIAPNARIMPIRVLDAAGRGNTADIAESIRWAADNGADVINMSLGGPLPSRIMQDAVEYAHRKGVTVIAAAGNSGWSMPSFPAAYRNVIAVSATQFDRSTTFYSNYGRYIDIAAPGGNTRVDQNNDGRPDGVLQETLVREDPAAHEFALYMGTSMASPHVAGVAALIHELGVTHPDRVEELLQASATTDVPDFQRDRYGAGLLDAGAATSQALTRFQAPRAVMAALFALFALALARRRHGARNVNLGATLGASVFVASGLATIALLLHTLGADASVLAPYASSVLRWPAALGLDRVATSAIVLSAIPVLGVYAVFGNARSRVGSGVLVGTMIGFGAFLLAEAIVPLSDVFGVPGMGLADRMWLGANAAVALFAAFAAARRRI